MGKLIGLVGFAGSGKGTVGDILIQNHGYLHDSFANPLKDVVSIIFNWERSMMEGDTAKSRWWREQKDRYWSDKLDKKFTPRLAMQLVGTEGIRNNVGDNVWLTSLEKRWLDRRMPDMVVTDCRFANEIQLIKDLGGKVIRVKRGPEPSWYNLMLFKNRGMADEQDEKEIAQRRAVGEIPHESETAWIGCDVDEVIENNGSLKELNDRVIEIIDQVMGGGEIQYSLPLSFDE